MCFLWVNKDFCVGGFHLLFLNIESVVVVVGVFISEFVQTQTLDSSCPTSVTFQCLLVLSWWDICVVVDRSFSDVFRFLHRGIPHPPLLHCPARISAPSSPERVASLTELPAGGDSWWWNGGEEVSGQENAHLFFTGSQRINLQRSSRWGWNWSGSSNKSQEN